jgi:hypothetical protein
MFSKILRKQTRSDFWKHFNENYKGLYLSTFGTIRLFFPIKNDIKTNYVSCEIISQDIRNIYAELRGLLTVE